MRVAITGSIACGKSTVTSYLLEKKYKVIDADKIAHDILDEEEVKIVLKKEFSDKIFTSDKVDRKKLGSIVFSDKEELKKLDSVMHPIIRKKIEEEYAKITDDIVFLDIALLYEVGFTDLVDRVIVVHTDYYTQLERLMARNNFSKEEADRRITSQMFSAEKIKLADYVINNSGSIEQTYNQLESILKILEGEEDGIKN